MKQPELLTADKATQASKIILGRPLPREGSSYDN